jgi:hypothetical protein
VWSEPDAAPQEGALISALRHAGADVPEALVRAVSLGFPLAADELVERASRPGHGVDVIRIHDVVRFDGIAHYWAAMATERPVAAAAVGALDPATLERVRAAVEHLLQPYTAADGTLRIPTEAVVLVRGPR